MSLLGRNKGGKGKEEKRRMGRGKVISAYCFRNLLPYLILKLPMFLESLFLYQVYQSVLLKGSGLNRTLS